MNEADEIAKRYERHHDPSRVLALSDGIFSIVITLLVFEIQVPDLSRDQTLLEAMQEVRPSLVAFLISFVVVAIAWAGHRDLFSLIRRAHLLIRPLDARSRWAGVAIAGVPAIAYAIAIAIAEQAPTASLAIYAAGPVLYFIGIWLARASSPPGSAERSFT